MPLESQPRRCALLYRLLRHIEPAFCKSKRTRDRDVVAIGRPYPSLSERNLLELIRINGDYVSMDNFLKARIRNNKVLQVEMLKQAWSRRQYRYYPTASLSVRPSQN